MWNVIFVPTYHNQDLVTGFQKEQKHRKGKNSNFRVEKTNDYYLNQMSRVNLTSW